jgi:two-component system phosphate regulon response regulator PhoB
MPRSSVPPRRSFSGVRQRGPLVLLVADEDSLRELYAAELAAAGFMVLEARDGGAALERALRFCPQAVVLELEREVIDGLKVARTLRADDRTREIAIIGLTGSSRKFGTLASSAGCDAILRKPVLAAALIGELVRLIARRAKQSSAIAAGGDPTELDPEPKPCETEHARAGGDGAPGTGGRPKG